MSELDYAKESGPTISRITDDTNVANYSLQLLRAEHFIGPTSDDENQFRTMPLLLRAIADWMDRKNVQDPEFDALKIGITFDDNDSDDFHHHATVYYRLENEKE